MKKMFRPLGDKLIVCLAWMLALSGGLLPVEVAARPQRTAVGDTALWRERAAPMVAGCTTDYQRARAVYDWVCQNIAYDMAGKVGDAESCWERRRGVCSGYSRLYVMLARGCGLEAVEVSGTARTQSFANGKAPHAWVRVKTERGWTLLDPTWGAGEVVKGKDGRKQFVSQMRPYWFDVDPRWLIFTHFPKQEGDQLLTPPVSAEQYGRLPLVWPTLEEWGVEPEGLLARCLEGKGGGLPRVYDVPPQVVGRLRLVDVPWTRTLRAGKEYRLVVEAKGEGFRPFVSPTTEWTREGDRYTAVVKPKAGQKWMRVNVGEADGEGGWTLYTLLEYGVR